MSMLRTAAFSLATTAALGLATFTLVMPAHAAAPSAPARFERLDGDMPQVRVSFGDLDLTTSAGRHAMHKRVAAAARMVCEEAAYNPDRLKARSAYLQCHEEAINNAITLLAAKMKENHLAQR